MKTAGCSIADLTIPIALEVSHLKSYTIRIMTSPEFLSTPNLTPEQRVRENQRLSDIDKQMSMRAMLAFEDIETQAAQKSRLIFEIPDDAQNAKDLFESELDPNYERATIIPVNGELAAWNISVSLQRIGLAYLGRDGLLYAYYEDEKYSMKKIALDDLPLADLIDLKAAIETEVSVMRTRKDFGPDHS